MALGNADRDFLLKPIVTRVKSAQDFNVPWLIKAVKLEDGALSFESPEYGRFSVGISALPSEWKKKKSNFWKPFSFLLKKKDSKDKIPWIPLKINQKIWSDVFDKEKHVQLMWRMPYVIMEDGIWYEIVLEAPTLKDSGREDFEEKDPTDLLGKTILVWKRKKTITAVVRVDWKPLFSREHGERIKSEIEMLIGISWWKGPIREKITTVYWPAIKWALWEEVKTKSIHRSLQFASANDVGVWTVDDQQWKIEVIFYESISMEISEKRTKPISHSTVDFWWFWYGLWWWMAMKWWWVTRSFSWWGTSFWEERTEKVNISTVRIEKPIAAFELCLVAEMADQKMQPFITK